MLEIKKSEEEKNLKISKLQNIITDQNKIINLTKPNFFCDFHGHSNMPNSSIYACSNVETKTSKRKKTWICKKRKFTKKGIKKKEKGSMVCTKCMFWNCEKIIKEENENYLDYIFKNRKLNSFDLKNIENYDKSE